MKKLLLTLTFVVLIFALLTGCAGTVPQPEVKKGEFDFSVTYELNGEIKTVSGVYVCEYNGIDQALDGGPHRDWNGYIQGGKMDEHIEIGFTEDGGTIILNLAFNPDYFMGEDLEGIMDVPAPELMIQYPYDELGGMQLIREPEIIEENYSAKIIGYEYDEPIENSFR